MSLESMFKTFMCKTESHIQNQGVALRNLENQVGQLANALSSRTNGSLPSNTETSKTNGNEHCKAIQLRSGKEVTSPVEQDDGKVVSKAKDKLIPEVESQVEETVKKIAPGATESIESVAG